MQVRRTTLADQVADELVARIDALGLRDGDEIPAESDVARDLGVNRLVVREAIRTLAAREILAPRQGRPARVTTPSGRVLGQIVDFRLRQQSLDLADLLETRRLVECDLARRAATRVRDDEASLDEVAEALAQMAQATGERDRFVTLDVRFHAAVADVAGAGLLGLVLEALEDVLVRAREATFDARERRGGDHSTTVAAHAAVLAALRDGDPDAAAAAMQEHLAQTAADVPGVTTGVTTGTSTDPAPPGDVTTPGPRTRR